MEHVREEISAAIKAIESLEAELDRNYELEEPDIRITSAEQLIYSLCNGEAANREKILKLPIKKALQFYYMNRLKKLNEMRCKISELEYYVEQKRKHGNG